MEKTKKIIVYTDGGSRGNPGPSAIGAYVETLNKKYGEFLGRATNNEAEYQAIILALKKISKLLGKQTAKITEVEVRSDSELIVNQLNGKYKLKVEHLFSFFIETWNLKQEFKNVEFIHIPREKNTIADGIVNEVLDENIKKNLFD